MKRSLVSLMAMLALGQSSQAAEEGQFIAEGTANPDTIAVSVSGSAESDAQWQVIIEGRYAVPRGTSVSPVFDFGARPVHVDALKVEFLLTGRDYCGASVDMLDVEYAHRPGVFVRYRPVRGNEFDLPDSRISRFQVHAVQPYYPDARCMMRISTLPHGSTPPDPIDPTDPSGYELIGALQYQGGFRQAIHADLNPDAGQIRYFWVRIPDFCAGAEILEAGLDTADGLVRAREIDSDRHIFEVPTGQGAGALAISVTMNGPRTLNCDIPVYVRYM